MIATYDLLFDWSFSTLSLQAFRMIFMCSVFFFASAFRPVWPGRCIWGLVCVPRPTRALDQGGIELSASGLKAIGNTTTPQTLLWFSCAMFEWWSVTYCKGLAPWLPKSALTWFLVLSLTSCWCVGASRVHPISNALYHVELEAF